MPLCTIVKVRLSTFLFGIYDKSFSCSTMRSTGDLLFCFGGGLNRRNGLSRVSLELLVVEDAEELVLLMERSGFALPWPA